MRVKIKKIPECLNSNNGSRFRVLQRYPVFQIARQHLPGALAKLGQKTTIIQKIWPKTLWKAKYALPMVDRFQHILIKKFSKLDNTLLMA